MFVTESPLHINFMKILAIETSCDETALALIEATVHGSELSYTTLGTVVNSQIEAHKPFGGVMPTIAKREHAQNIIPILHSLLQGTKMEEELRTLPSNEQTQKVTEILAPYPGLVETFFEFVTSIKKPDIDLIAVTSGPGLEPALWVGINVARALSYMWQIPLMPTNHMEGHIVSVLKEGEHMHNFAFPAVALLISGGHTELILVRTWGDYQLIGQTRDDAVGEAFDKVARLLGLSYPGGPQISKLAAQAREEKMPHTAQFPRPMIHSKDFDFSFAGLKTAVLYYLSDQKAKPDLQQKFNVDEAAQKDIAREFEDAVTEVLFAKTKRALGEHGVQTLIIGGGVIANTHIRATFKKLEVDGIKVLIPEMHATTDNALMIAIAGFLKAQRHKAEICPEIKAEGNLTLTE